MGVIASSGLLPQSPIGDRGAEWTKPEGQSWQQSFELRDASGDPFDYAGLTSTECKVYTTAVGGSLVLSFTCTWATVDGQSRLTIFADDSETVGLAGTQRVKSYVWLCKITDATDTLFLWAPHNSYLHVTTEA